MPAHKFAVGQTVRFTPDMGQAMAVGRAESFKIVKIALTPELIPAFAGRCGRN